MKLIEYEYLPKEEQERKKGIILDDGDELRVIQQKTPHTELIIKCNKETFEIINLQDEILNNSLKKDIKKEDNH